jgi:hypothetical protein
MERRESPPVHHKPVHINTAASKQSVEFPVPLCETPVPPVVMPYRAFDYRAFDSSPPLY